MERKLTFLVDQEWSQAHLQLTGFELRTAVLTASNTVRILRSLGHRKL